MKKIYVLASIFFYFINFISAQPGRLDPSFGDNGIVNTNLGKPYLYNGPPAYQILLQADGSMYVTEGSALTKRRADGSVDSSFRINLKFNGTSLVMAKAAIQPDGKIVVIGTMDDSTAYDPDNGQYASALALARYKPDGSVDSSFSEDGLQTTSFSVYNSGISVVIQKNGKIIAAGSSNSKLALARYNSDGSPDKTFDGDGKLTTNAAWAFASLAVGEDGKIVLAGTLELAYDPNSGQYPSDFAVARFNTDGSPDKTFDGDGIQTTDFGSVINVAEAAVIQSDGKIIVGGYFVQNYMGIFGLARYNLDGSPDKSFSDDGKQVTEFGPSSAAGIYAIAIQSDGKIVVSGDCLNSNNSQINYLSLARYKTDGSLDKNFSGDGKILDFASQQGNNKFFAVAIQNNGKIVSGGSYNSFTAFGRYNTDGSPDSTFDKDGKLIDGLHAGNTIFKSTAVQKDGKTVAVGRAWNGNDFDFAIARFNLNGSPDNTFSNTGAQLTDFNAGNDYANSVAIQSDGKIVVGGSSANANNIGVFSIARYNSDGSLDKTFSSDGKQQTNSGDSIFFSAANAVAIQADGKIVAVGRGSFDFHEVFAVARFNTNGVLDSSFSGDGKQTIDFEENEYTSYATSVAVQRDGKILVGGISGQYPFSSLARLNTDGSLDNTFSDDGKTTYGYESFNDAQSLSVAVADDGKILVGGYSYYRDNSNNFVGRYNADGRFDSSFSNDGREETGFPENRGNISFDFSNPGNPVIAIQKDGKVVVSGSALTRYNTNGSLDSTFGDNGIEATELLINSVAISGNKLYAAGSAQNPRSVGLVARFLLDSDSSQTPPAVSITTPADNAVYIAGNYIKVNVTASDADGAITKVEFYSDSILLHTETVAPYGYQLKHLAVGNYIITAKAYDNSGNVTTSAPVHFSVVENQAPTVSITTPANNAFYIAGNYIKVDATAADSDGTIAKVEFYSDSTLLHTQTVVPYGYQLKHLPAGTYTITAKATDNLGLSATSAPVTIMVVDSALIVSSRPYKENEKTALKDAFYLRLSPNPATNIVIIQTSGLQPDKPATLSIISLSGNVLKNIQISNSSTSLDVSTLASGVYTIKIISGEKITYKQFVKL